MTPGTLYRWSGAALIVGGLLAGLGQVLQTIFFHSHQHTPEDVSSSGWPLATGLILVGYILITVVFPAVYLRQAMQSGRLGFIGFALFALSLPAIVAIVAIDTFILPILAQSAPPSVITKPSMITNPAPLALLLALVVAPILLQSIGGILLGIASMRANVLPRGAGALLIAQGILNFVVVPLPPSTLNNFIQLAPVIALSLSYVWFGVALMAQRNTSAAAPSLTMSAATAR